MPGVREAIEQAHYAEAEGEVARAAKALMRLTRAGRLRVGRSRDAGQVIAGLKARTTLAAAI